MLCALMSSLKRINSWSLGRGYLLTMLCINCGRRICSFRTVWNTSTWSSNLIRSRIRLSAQYKPLHLAPSLELIVRNLIDSKKSIVMPHLIQYRDQIVFYWKYWYFMLVVFAPGKHIIPWFWRQCIYLIEFTVPKTLISYF